MKVQMGKEISYSDYNSSKGELFNKMFNLYIRLINNYDKLKNKTFNGLKDCLTDQNCNRIDYLKSKIEKIPSNLSLTDLVIMTPSKIFLNEMRVVVETIQKNIKIIDELLICGTRADANNLTKSSYLNKIKNLRNKIDHLILEFDKNSTEFNENEALYQAQKEFKVLHKSEYKKIKRERKKEEVNLFKAKLKKNFEQFKIIFIVSSFILALIEFIVFITTNNIVNFFVALGSLFLPMLYEIKNDFLKIFIMLINFCLSIIITILNVILVILVDSWLYPIKKYLIIIPLHVIPTKWIKTNDTESWLTLGMRFLQVLGVIVLMGIGILPTLLIELKVIPASDVFKLVVNASTIFVLLLGIGLLVNIELKDIVLRDKETYNKAYGIILALITFISLIATLISLH